MLNQILFAYACSPWVVLPSVVFLHTKCDCAHACARKHRNATFSQLSTDNAVEPQYSCHEHFSYCIVDGTSASVSIHCSAVNVPFVLI